jgi:4-hydroxy-3-methylbut-2-enyl diphosphate reductase
MAKENVELDGTYDKTAFKVGDIIDVAIINTSPLEVSRKQYLINQKENAFIEELKDGKEFKVTISGFNKGGLTGKLGSFTVFVPASLIRMGYVKPEEFEKYNGKVLRLKLVELRGKTIIGSAKEIIIEERKRKEEVRAAAIKAFFDSIEVGQVIEGKVVRFTDFGAFVNVNGFDCLAHISDLSWTNIKKAEDVLTKDKVYEFVILKIDPEKQHVSIGYKQLQPKPWDLAADKYPAGSTIKGKVVRIAPFGAFVEVEPGIDGLVHVSQITHDWIENPASVLKVGDEIEAKVLEVKPDAQKLTLSIKALQPEPEVIRPRKKAETEEDQKKEDKKPKEKKSKVKKDKAEDEIHEWKGGGAGASIGDLLKDINLDIESQKAEEKTQEN